MPDRSEKSLASLMLDEEPELREAVAGSGMVEKVMSTGKKIELNGQTLYVVEGDVILDEDQLLIYARQREALEQAQAADEVAQRAGLGQGIVQSATQELVGIMQAGKIVRWKPGLTLTYCVLRSTFSDADRYDTARTSVRKAASDWEALCGVSFEYKEALDISDSLRPKGVLFVVREIDAGGQFIASAFFPNDPPNRRVVLIDPSYFDPNLGFDKVGVLRHELGHVLGFRHEHIRSGAPPACPDESVFGTFNITNYDPQSVMHYFCGGMGRRTLAFTEIDKVGAQKVYGPPLDAFLFRE